MGFPDQVKFVGHGVGIELELPVIAHGFIRSKKEWFSPLEPKFVFPDGAVGVENTYLVTKEQAGKLTVFEEGIIYV